MNPNIARSQTLIQKLGSAIGNEVIITEHYYKEFFLYGSKMQCNDFPGHLPKYKFILTVILRRFTNEEI